MSVGVLEYSKLRDLYASHTLGWYRSTEGGREKGHTNVTQKNQTLLHFLRPVSNRSRITSRLTTLVRS
jgi:hypothetical protein